MCGIVGYIGFRDAYPIIIKGLHRLEYRGYDSAGISLFDKEPKVYQATLSEIHNTAKATKRVRIAWLLLTIVMITLYFIFNGH